MAEVAEAIAIHAKYILDVYSIRFYYAFSGFYFCSEIVRGRVSIREMEGRTEHFAFEEDLLGKGIPIYYPDRNFQDNDLLKNGFFDRPAVNSLYALPLKISGEQEVVIMAASKEAHAYGEPDFRFVKLLAELASNKLGQLLLVRRVENKNKELEDVNEELSCLNEDIKNLNLHLEDEVQKRTIQLTEANQELNTIFYRTSHDFRGPLTSVLGLTNLARHITDDPAVLQLFSHCEATVSKMDKMLQKLKMLSYDDSCKEDELCHTFSSSRLVERLLQKLSASIEKKALNISLEVEPDIIFVADESLYLAILENLLENAVIFSRSGSGIHIKCREQENQVLFEITDVGEGIPEEYMENIFQMYFKASESSEGNGLGLYVVKRLTDKLKGEIKITSEAGKGTRAKVLLPHGAA